MASKRKRVAGGGSSKNRISSGAGASTDLMVQKFNNSDALNEFSLLMKKPVAKERGFEPAAGLMNLLNMIHDMGWKVFCKAPAPIPLSVVREFYAHAKEAQNGISWVRGVTVDYRAAAIRDVLKLRAKPAGVEDWTLKARDEVNLEEIVEGLCVPGTKWTYKSNTTEPLHFPSSTMNKYARAWHLFICANVMQSGHTTQVNVDRAILLWGILNQKYIDLGYLMHQNMLKFLRSGTNSIPHASIVTRLCTSVGVTWADDEQLQLPMAPINHKTIGKMEEWPGGIPRQDGLGYDIGVGGSDEQQQVPEAPRRARAEPSQSSQFDVRSYLDTQFRRQNRRIDAIYEANRQFTTDMTSALSTAFQATGGSVQWPVFGSHAMYPPPDSPDEGDEDE